MTYNQAIEKLGNREQKKIANNTYLVRRNNGAVAIRLHATDILTFTPDGLVTIRTGGWQTVTTKDRINQYTSVGLYQKAGVWYYRSGDEFSEGDVVRAETGAFLRDAKGRTVNQLCNGEDRP